MRNRTIVRDPRGRRRACARIREITREDINFRHMRDEIVNPLMLQCVDSPAIVRDVKCLGDAALAGIERTIEPLVAETPECTDWRIATAGYGLEPPGAASVEPLTPLPGVAFRD